jgi:hypothetical protein
MTIPNLPEFFRIFRKNRFYTASKARGKKILKGFTYSIRALPGFSLYIFIGKVSEGVPNILLRCSLFLPRASTLVARKY